MMADPRNHRNHVSRPNSAGQARDPSGTAPQQTEQPISYNTHRGTISNGVPEFTVDDASNMPVTQETARGPSDDTMLTHAAVDADGVVLLAAPWGPRLRLGCCAFSPPPAQRATAVP